MFKNRLFLMMALVLWCAIGVCTTGCGRDEKIKSEQRYRLTYSVFFPSVHIQSRLAQEWADEVEKRTQGRVHIDVFPGGVLSGASENYDCVVNGVSDLGMSCLSYSRGLFPLLECLDFPFGYPDGRTATAVANAFVQKFKPEELAETQLMYLHAHGPGVIATRTPIKNAADLSNLSVRGTGITAQIIKAIGGNAVGLPQGETFEALRKGVVDATLCPIETLKGWKQGEVIDDVVRIPSIGYTTTMFVTMNKNSWNRLPKDIQKIIEEINAEWIPKHGRAWDEADAEGMKFIESLHKDYQVLAEEEDAKVAFALSSLFDNWSKKAEAKGLPGTEAIAFVRQQLASSKKSAENR